MLAVDENGTPRWDSARQRSGPKEDFAYEAALRISNGQLTLNQLKDHIISVANTTFQSNGGSKDLTTLNDVKDTLGGSAKDWFHELKRVVEHPQGLEEIIERKGKNLTALSRKYGPIQAQRRKGFSRALPSHAIKNLIEILSRISTQIDYSHDRERTSAITRKSQNDIKVYRQWLAEINGAHKHRHD